MNARRLLCGLLGLLILSTQLAQAEIYALVVGIDEYQHISDLDGAVNDATDIAEAVAKLSPADLVLLTNGHATRDRFFSAWRDFQRRAQPGDTILVTYAGHGGSEPATYPETESDGRDETFLLSGFRASTEASGERIRDDEIADMISHRPDVLHIVVADSCHSGTTTRSSQFDLKYRFFEHGALTDDPLPPPPSPPANEFTNSIVFGAVADREKVPEIGIDGQIRGALSYAFAQGIRGQADRDGNGVITKGELETHVRRFVKSALAGRQNPQVSPVGRSRKPLFSQPVPVLDKPKAFSEPFDALPYLPLQIVGTPQITISHEDFTGVERATDQAHQGIVVDFDHHELRSSSGDLLRRLTREVGYDWTQQIQGTINKMRAIRALQESSLSGDLDVYLPLGDQIYPINSRIQVQVEGRKTSHVTMINLSSDGMINYLYPLTAPFIDKTNSFNDPDTLHPDIPLGFMARISPPFGAEHVLVIETSPDDTQPIQALKLHTTLRRAAYRLRHTTDVPSFWNEMHRVLKNREYSVGLHAFFTKEEE